MTEHVCTCVFNLRSVKLRARLQIIILRQRTSAAACCPNSITSICCGYAVMEFELIGLEINVVGEGDC